MKAIWITLAIAASLSTVACGGSGCAGMCKDLSKCEDAPDDFDKDACEEGCEELKDGDCGDEYIELIDCADACDDTASAEECAEEGEAYATCLGLAG